ncbi:DUF6011 domain-containing protein [Mycolicibacterium elephantis]|uniref:DUF6011 domain-containing protein n=1 Tax=Mycolicibacterium elephantis TaxID=81858 RepID=UPI003908B8A2
MKRRSPGQHARAASTTPIATAQYIGRCQHCRRRLSAKRSVLRCAGPVCWRRHNHGVEHRGPRAA